MTYPRLAISIPTENVWCAHAASPNSLMPLVYSKYYGMTALLVTNDLKGCRRERAVTDWFLSAPNFYV
jgi:hypothetical protein